MSQSSTTNINFWQQSKMYKAKEPVIKFYWTKNDKILRTVEIKKKIKLN